MTQRCFVFEWICAGACEDDGFAQALIADGRAMLTAVAQDVASLSDCSAFTLSAVGPIADNVDVIATTNTSWREAYDKAVAEADVVLVIAPEFAVVDEDLLSDSTKFANCKTSSIAHFSDKLAVYDRLVSSNVLMPRTVDANNIDVTSTERHSAEFTVLKPRDGVGEGFRRFPSQQALAASLAPQQKHNARPHIAQTFVDGSPRSIAAIVGPAGYEVWPICEQQLTKHGNSLVYGGGRIEPASEQSLPPWLDCVLTAVPGLRGYVSIDYIESEEGPVFIELNPRISVSYIGYRAATDDNLAEWLLGRASRPVRWNSGRWIWTKHGDITREA